MSPRFISSLVLALVVGMLPAGAAEIGKPVADVPLIGVDGKTTSLHVLKGKTIVAVFLSFECPVSNSYAPILNELAKSYAGKNVAFIALAPTKEDLAALARQAKEFDLCFPLYRDAELKVARALDAKKVPEAFVLDKDLKLCYRGRIDDGYAQRLVPKKKFDRHDLRDAIDAVLAGKPIR